LEDSALTQYDPNTDPTRVPPPGAVYTETVETVVVREPNNTGWWIAGILGALVILAVLWILFARGAEPQTDEALLQAQADAAAAQAQADSALIQGQVAGAQASVDIARADAARSQADAIRAASEVRAAEARSSAPVIIERQVPAPAPAPSNGGVAVVTPTAPQG
jgi:endonuclease/exonuclease/phosphatase (EEP) superfamily protein YafD